MFIRLKIFCNSLALVLVLPLSTSATSLETKAADYVQNPISLSGIIQAAETLKVQASVGGRVTAIHVKENQTVAKDQLLLTLHHETQKRQLELTRLQHKVNENSVADREVQLNLAKVQIAVSVNNVKDLETNLKDIQRRLLDEKTLFNQGSSTRSQLESLQLQYNRGELALKNVILGLKRTEQEVKRAQLGVENARLAVERSKHDVALREETLGDTQIKAKITGIITAKFFEEGEVITPGAVLFQIIDITQVEIGIQVGEEDLPNISEGQSVVFTTPGYQNTKFSGTIERISWSADPETGRFPIFVKADNKDHKLRAGMSAKVYLLWKK
ncbi:MAG: efflux RND transporter periplasmic adaptor subunit [SAR324 cluster bacterium]|nr:efflux RND transporter periplasmic adaptor subunit [SAR324 cluster bacterium]MBL7034983.1 efflux RND transporter periplasmic adaptor subunit [SAR324 cluster bacterium]